MSEKRGLEEAAAFTSKSREGVCPLTIPASALWSFPFRYLATAVQPVRPCVYFQCDPSGADLPKGAPCPGTICPLINTHIRNH